MILQFRDLNSYDVRVLLLDADGNLFPSEEPAFVSSSAMSRLDACFTATGRATIVPPEHRYSAEDSLPVPTSKPDPAIYLWAAAHVGGGAGERLAVEDSVPGAQSAVAAGIPTIGNVMFVPPNERAGRVEALREAGVCAVVDSWAEMADLLDGVEAPGNGLTTSRPA